MIAHAQKLQQKQQEWFHQLLLNSDVDLNNNASWLQKLRKDAGRFIEDSPVLNRKQEAWRYDHMDNVFKNNFDPGFDGGANVDELNIKDLNLPLVDGHRLVFVNGHYSSTLSDLKSLPEGVVLGGVGDAIRTMPENMRHWFDADHQHNDQIFNALSNAMFNDGVYLHIDKSVKLSRPVEIVYLNRNKTSSLEYDGSMIQTRNIIDLREGASATVMEYYVGSHNDEAYFHNNVTEISLADNAQLNHVRLQDESRRSYHMSSVYASQNKSSHYHGVFFALGGAWSKTNCNVSFKAQQAECDLQGVYMVGDQQHTDFHLDVQHLVPACRSQEKFKGILYGQGRAVFDGRILVDKQAQHSDAALTNDNLLLVRDAEVDTKPQLEIYADDVKCSHGTTVGRLDQQQMFYLRSRGIDEVNARNMLCQGFMYDIINEVDQAYFRDYLMGRISLALNKSKLNSASLNR